MKKRLLMLQLALFVMVSSTIYAQSTRLTGITFEDGEPCCALSYDEQGRVTRIEMRDEGSMYEISYDPIVIKEYVEDWKGEVLWELYCTYSAKTDSKGRVVQMDVEDRYGVMMYSDTYTYDDDGYLVKKVEKDADGEATQTTQYTWKDGNLVATELTMNYLSGWDDEKGDWHEAYLTKQEKVFFTYGSQPLGSLPFTAGLIYYQDFEVVSGLFGKTCKNLPTRILNSGLPTEYPEEWPEEYRYDSRGWEFELTFSYTFNADMTVATEKCIYQGENENTVVEPPAGETFVYIYEQGVNGIGELIKDQSHNAQTLYDLSGRRIVASSNRPTRKGIYVKDGRKVVMK